VRSWGFGTDLSTSGYEHERRKRRLLAQTVRREWKAAFGDVVRRAVLLGRLKPGKVRKNQAPKLGIRQPGTEGLRMTRLSVPRRPRALRILNILPDPLFLRLMYYAKRQRWLNLRHPESFNEKLHWIKLYDRDPMYTRLVDKYEVRKYVARTVGDSYLIPLLGVYDAFDEVDFDGLPHQFVLKCTRGSGAIICTDKSRFDIPAARREIERSFKLNYYWIWREWPYKDVRPRIICEEYKTDESRTQLKDYKFYCFGGEPIIIQVDYDRFSGHKRNIYDTRWNYMPVKIQYPTDPSTVIPRPRRLDDMLELSRRLSRNIPFVRVDLYCAYESVYFGEMTFFPEAGYVKTEPEEFELEMGRWIRLPQKRRP